MPVQSILGQTCFCHCAYDDVDHLESGGSLSRVCTLTTCLFFARIQFRAVSISRSKATFLSYHFSFNASSFFFFFFPLCPRSAFDHRENNAIDYVSTYWIICRCVQSSASDYVEVSNFMTVDRKIPRYCGQIKELKMESDAEFFRVSFKSNDRFDGTGFFAHYQFSTVADAVTVTRRRNSSSSSSSSATVTSSASSKNELTQLVEQIRDAYITFVFRFSYCRLASN